MILIHDWFLDGDTLTYSYDDLGRVPTVQLENGQTIKRWDRTILKVLYPFSWIYSSYKPTLSRGDGFYFSV